MTKYSAVALVACLLAGCAPEQQTASTTPPTPQEIAAAKARRACLNAGPATGSHIVDTSSCGPDPFVRHGMITNPNGSPLEAEGNPPQH